MNTVLLVLGSVLLCFAVGFVGARLQVRSLAEWYPTLRKSPLTPPNRVFPLAWGVLYACMGISLGLLLAAQGPQRLLCISIFAVQLMLNGLWSIAFFYYRSPRAGLVVVAALWCAIVWFAVAVFPISQVASFLFVPYIVWVAFAAYLNLYIVQHNKG
ncbi:TspO/MBR family protein [Desulfovibrio cuneatus]|uniref:TspO/MBR family protein n=1 Tax=Desulfovibrio cuneatus TaxID=159728 RepID=UPI0004265F79|nr:TspO/MBR family protein [Desulfovibrio cuneatus]